MAKREIEFTTRLTREDVAGLIEPLIEGLKAGKLKIKKSSEELELDVPRVIDLEIEASIDEERAEFEIEVSWRTNRAENPDLPLHKDDEDTPGKDELPQSADARGSSVVADKPKKETAAKTASKSPARAKKPAAPRAGKSATASASKAKSKAAVKEKVSKE